LDHASGCHTRLSQSQYSGAYYWRCKRRCAIVTCVPSDRKVTVAQANPARRRLVAVDIFAGVGGMSLGFEQAGFDVLAAVEYDPIHAVTHKYNFPSTEIVCRDIRRVTRADLLAAAHRGWRRHHPVGPRWNETVDAVIGGPSCQGFSVMGRHERDDERNQLLLEFVRVVADIRPRAFCLENVPGLLGARHTAILGRALGILKRAGYRIGGAESKLNAADFGVPQNRVRVLIMGTLDAELVPLANCSDVDRVTVAEALEGLPDPVRYPELVHGDSVRLDGADLAAREATVSRYARILAGLETDAEDRSRPRLWDSERITNSRLTAHSPDSVARFAATGQGSTESVSKCYRLAPERQARTLRAGTGRERGAFTSPRPIHPTHPRAITVREAARLHAFPDWFRFNTTNWHGHRQIGNSVPPLLARAAGQHIALALGASPARGRRVVSLGKDDLLIVSPRDAMKIVSAVPEQTPAKRTRRPRSAEPAALSGALA
jgi:DNA (cytosine-5)-methyltransferase 1